MQSVIGFVNLNNINECNRVLMSASEFKESVEKWVFVLLPYLKKESCHKFLVLLALVLFMRDIFVNKNWCF